jgi:hypothetical protein
MDGLETSEAQVLSLWRLSLMLGLKQRVQDLLLNDPELSGIFLNRVYYFGQQVNGIMVYEISRSGTPEVFDNTLMVLLPSAFIVTETNNDDAFAVNSRRDFFSIYCVNTSEQTSLRIRQVVSTISGGGIAEIKFVNGQPERYDNDLKAALTLQRFMCVYFE